MPLSEHEQRMLDQIESALYAEDPKFASNVHGRRLGGSSSRRNVKAALSFVVGLALLIVGIFFKLGNFPILALVGFLVMFAGGLWAMFGGRGTVESVKDAVGSTAVKSSGSGSSGPSARKRLIGEKGPNRRGMNGKLAQRMEDRFRRRFY